VLIGLLYGGRTDIETAMVADLAPARFGSAS